MILFPVQKDLHGPQEHNWDDIQEDRFNSWAHENSVSISNTAFKNTNYTASDPLTHNYSSLGIPGHIRGVFNWFYDTQDSRYNTMGNVRICTNT